MRNILTVFILALTQQVNSQIVLKPDRVFDGVEMHDDWEVVVGDGKIQAVGLNAGRNVMAAEIIDLKGKTLLPGLIEGHSHMLLYPYDQTSWNDQVLKESEAERVARATIHARNTLMSGFTSVRDLGSEGAGYADVGLRDAINKGIIPGPYMKVAGPALVTTGSYGPKGFSPGFSIPKGAEEADGPDLFRSVRDQIGRGADLIKVYADYRWGPEGEAMPTYTLEELKLIVEVATSSGRPVVAHAYTDEGIRRAVVAGVETIEHGGEGTFEIFQLMAERGVALCPTLAAGESILSYNGWKKGRDPDPSRIRTKKDSFQAALSAGVTIVAGGDVGVFEHGDNVLELELMVEYGMETLQVLRSATSVNADALHFEGRGRVTIGSIADLIAVEGNPLENISLLRKVSLVMKEGELIR